MLTFKKGNYSKEELLVLYDVLTDAHASLRCVESGCDDCPNRKPCADITRCCEYVFRLLNSMENQINNTNSQTFS